MDDEMLYGLRERRLVQMVDGGKLISQCANCKQYKIRIGDQDGWIESDSVPDGYGNITHGLCKPCAVELYGE